MGKKNTHKYKNSKNVESPVQTSSKSHSDPPPSQAKESSQGYADRPICPETIKGTDDTGRFYNCHDELLLFQESQKEELYRANALWWADGGYNGSNDDEAMIGDEGGVADGVEGLEFLDRYLAFLKTNNAQSSSTHVGSPPKQQQQQQQQQQQPQQQQQSLCFDHAVDLGAGVGRVTKLVLLKRYGEVRLVEGDEGWSKRSRVYLGRKRASRCSFTNQRLDALTRTDLQSWGEPADLMWVQWTFQYLIDADVVNCLKVLSSGLRPSSGILIVKENRPYGTQREDRFQMDRPDGANQRYDITRSDNHHRLLFQLAGLKVVLSERGKETNTYALAVP